MRRKDVKNRILNDYKTLELVNLNRTEFLQKLGSEKALNKFIDDILDDINEHNKILKTIENENRNKK